MGGRAASRNGGESAEGPASGSQGAGGRPEVGIRRRSWHRAEAFAEARDIPPGREYRPTRPVSAGDFGVAIDQPTNRRPQGSSTTARYSRPAEVGTCVMSATHSQLVPFGRELPAHQRRRGPGPRAEERAIRYASMTPLEILIHTRIEDV